MFVPTLQLRVCVEESKRHLELPCSEIDAPTQRGSDGKYRRRLYVAVKGHLTWDTRPTDQDLTSNFGRGGGSLGSLPRCSFRPGITLGRLPLDRVQHPRAHNVHARRCVCAPPPGYETSDFIDEKLHVLGALGRFPSVKLKMRALEWAVAGDVRSQDNYSVFGSVAADGSTVAWEYVQAKWDALSTQYSQIVVGRILCVSIANFHTEQAAKAVEAFLVGYPKARLPAR
ncbi:hypothetical protein DYB26_007712 [Aphanomyces astaci]|uniref:ERAP1-like C-terminal domain-containing protein n=1 Tax=Aphanomyces astaci TaxID=112090 RepID=A0A3R6WXG6_APHAT|nr:hypothetical protein DYB26_007712 [Aphanomyces astaci]